MKLNISMILIAKSRWEDKFVAMHRNYFAKLNQ